MKTTGYNSVKSWAIAVCCGLIHCLFLLPMRISSMLFVAFVDYYETDRKNAALFLTVSIVLKYVTGPLSGFLGEIFDLRKLVIFGCLVSCIGTGCCYWAKSILAVTIFIGIIFGFGNAIVHPLIPQIIKQHFNKNYANANGISNAVQSLASSASLPMMSFIIYKYEVTGALLIASGIMLHSIPLAMFLWNPKYNNLPTDEISCTDHYQDLINSSKSEMKNKNATSTDEEIEVSNFGSTENTELNKHTAENFTSTVDIHLQKYDRVCHATEETVTILEPYNEIPQKIVNAPIETFKANTNCTDHDDGTSRTIKSIDPPFVKQNKFRRAFETAYVLKNPIFFIIMLCLSLHAYVVLFFYTICFEVVKDKGFLPSQEDFPLIFFTLAEVGGHTCLGWVVDKEYLSVTSYISICYFTSAVVCSIFVWFNNSYIIIVSAAVFGLCKAAILSVSPSLIYKYIEQKHQTMAITSRLFLHGPLALTLAPLIGYFRDTLGSYDGALYFLTTICAVCAILYLLLPSIAKCLNQKDLQQNIN